MTDTNAAPVLRIRGLRKSFTAHLSLGRTQVLKGVDLDVLPGEIYGLLGPNGAGKTTMLKLILALLRPDAGTVSLFGLPSSDPASRRKVGFLPENPYFYDYLTAREFLDFYARLLGMSRAARAGAIDSLLRRVGLEGSADKPLRKFSKGMVQRVGMAQALLGEPELVILDEPMSGLDPIGRREFRDIILSLRRAGRTVFFSSHILQDAEMICDRVGILKDGLLVREGSLGALLDAGPRAFEVTIAGGTVPPGDAWTVLSSRESETLMRVEGQDGLDRLLRVLAAGDLKLLSLSPIRLSLEELFLREVQGAPAVRPKPFASVGEGR